MEFKKIALIGAAVSFLSFCLSLVSVLIGVNKGFSPSIFDILYLILIFLASVMMLWGLRVRWHIGAGAILAMLGVFINSMYYGYLSVTSGQDYAILSGVLNFIFAFLLFDSVIMVIHTMLNIKLVKPFAALIILVCGLVGAVLALYNLFYSLISANPDYLSSIFVCLALLGASGVVLFAAYFINKTNKQAN
ncbi:MAG: hypothetical protein WC366_05495 [Bacilli bacterium]|jgi:drug/metabolite transporter (DMT)-like permease